jgi:hypothetical protein
MEALVYLPDIETLHGIHTDWPEEMRVILCLHDDGHCDLRLHHVEEGVEAALGDVIEQLRVAADRVQVVPATGKYPSRQMRFAEEQALCRLLDEITHLPKMATDYALDYRYRKEAAVSRELSEKADRLAERVQRRSSGDRNAQQDDTPLIVAHVSQDSESYRLLLSDGTPPLRAGREVFGSIVEVASDGGSVHVSWEGNVEYNDVIVFPRATVPASVVERHAQSNMRARLHLTPRGALVVPEHAEQDNGSQSSGRDRLRRLSRVAAAMAIVASAGVLTAGVAAAFG